MCNNWQLLLDLTAYQSRSVVSFLLKNNILQHSRIKIHFRPIIIQTSTPFYYALEISNLSKKKKNSKGKESNKQMIVNY